MRKIGTQIVFLFLIVRSISAQDVEFSQFYANRLYLNPALTGSEVLPALSITYRNQWPQNSKPFVSYSASFDRYVDAVQGGLGIHVLQDVQGDGALKTSMISGLYAYTLNVSRKLDIRVGFKCSVIQRKLDWSSLVFSDMLDPLYGVLYPSKEIQPDKLSKNYIDFSAGVLFDYGPFYLGAAFDHISEPDIAIDSQDAVLPRKYTIHCGAAIPFGFRGLRKNTYLFSPNLLYQKQQGFEQMNYGMYVSKRNWILGLWFRQNLSFDFDALIGMFGYQVNEFRISYSYDYVISNLVKTNSGAHEISLSYLFGKRKFTYPGTCKYIKKKRVRAVKCPKF